LSRSNEKLRESPATIIGEKRNVHRYLSTFPDSFHGDPADRIIVATARLHNLAIMTRDKKIIAYGKKRFVRAIKA